MAIEPVCFFGPRWRSGWARAGCFALLTFGIGGAQAADDALVAAINEYRLAPEGCAGRQATSLGPLAPNDQLARQRVTSAEQLQGALQQAGYQPAAAQVIAITGPSSREAALAALKERYCAILLDPQYAEIGVLREGNAWQVILARPLLPSAMGDWQQAGREILRQVNDVRGRSRRCGNQAVDAVAPLTWNEALAEASLAHSRDMATRNYFSHQDRNGDLAGKRATRVGYRWQAIGENIAAGQGSAKQVVSGWLASPAHCFNIMNPDFTEMGAAYALNPQSDAAIYWTQVFGTPR
jgi:uncharacterized protein YkwD